MEQRKEQVVEEGRFSTLGGRERKNSLHDKKDEEQRRFLMKEVCQKSNN